jgi:hypothetical protein
LAYENSLNHSQDIEDMRYRAIITSPKQLVKLVVNLKGSCANQLSRHR